MQEQPEEDPITAQVIVSRLASGNIHIQQMGDAEDKTLAIGMLHVASIVLISPPQPVKPPIQLIHSSQLPENGR